MRVHDYLLWAAVAVGVFLCGCSGDEKSRQENIRFVRTMTIGEYVSSTEWVGTGTARDAMEMQLSFRVGGEIMTLPVTRGMEVKAGDVIAGLDPTDFELSVKKAVANLQNARASYGSANAEFRRFSSLLKKQVVSRSEYDTAKARNDSALARVAALRKGVDIARKQQEYTVLRAPMAGTINAVVVENHQVVGVGETVAVLNAGGGMEVEIGVPESIIASVRPGHKTSITFGTLPGTRFSGTVSEVGIASETTFLYPVSLTLDEQDERIRAGMAGEVTFSFAVESREDVVVPPVAVIGRPDGGNHVWVVDTGSLTATRRDVSVGRLTPSGLMVRGLYPGDVLIVRGMNFVREGMKVKPRAR